MNKADDIKRFESTQEILSKREKERIARGRKLWIEGFFYCTLLITLLVVVFND